jgi:transcriptional modulator of MazE/toxin, MazF
MSFVPDRGDLVWLDLDPQAGHEQGRRGPALTLSPKAYKAKAGLALFCPVTSRAKGYPFEVSLPQGLPVVGVVLADQVRSLDYQARRAEFIARAPEEVVRSVLTRIRLLLE